MKQDSIWGKESARSKQVVERGVQVDPPSPLVWVLGGGKTAGENETLKGKEVG